VTITIPRLMTELAIVGAILRAVDTRDDLEHWRRVERRLARALDDLLK